MSDIQEIIAQARLCGWRTPGRVIRLCDEIERLTRERDEARKAAHQLFIGRGTDWQKMEWLKEREGEG